MVPSLLCLNVFLPILAGSNLKDFSNFVVLNGANLFVMLEIFFQIVFWVAVLAMFHSYVVFPVLVRIISSTKKPNEVVFRQFDENLPHVSVIMSVYNEERIIRQKIESVFNTSYPKDRLQVLVGSDASIDNTHHLLQELSAKFPNLKLHFFVERSGKPNVINQLVEKATTELIILTDASGIFEKDTIFQMVKHYKNPEISLVGANLISNQTSGDGIGLQEYSFMAKELMVKYWEGLAWGTVIGAYGACFALRRVDYSPVPSNYLVDDFFITMMVLKAGRKAIYELDSKCYLDVPKLLKEEFRRKTRIAAGNFQNLVTFSSILVGPNLPLSFCFLSHKVLRWFGPFFILVILIVLPFLVHIPLYKLAAIAASILLLLPIADYFLKKLGIHVLILRFVTHFIGMNAALLVGFLKYVKGIKTNAWQPTKRNA